MEHQKTRRPALPVALLCGAVLGGRVNAQMIWKPSKPVAPLCGAVLSGAESSPLEMGTVVTRRPDVRCRFGRSGVHPLDLETVLSRRPAVRCRIGRLGGEHPMHMGTVLTRRHIVRSRLRWGELPNAHADMSRPGAPLSEAGLCGEFVCGGGIPMAQRIGATRPPDVPSRVTRSMALPMHLGTVVTRGPDVRSRISRPREHPMDLVNGPDPSPHCAEPVQVAGGSTRWTWGPSWTVAPTCDSGGPDRYRSRGYPRVEEGRSVTAVQRWRL